MRWLTLLALVVACSSKPEPVPPKRPNNELIVGEFERHPPDGTTIARFRGDGSITVAHDKDSLDRKNLATGTYQLEGDQLTLSYTGGEMCGGGGGPGVYKVVISKVGIHFTKVSDSCDRRAKMDGQTWFRVK